jgi:hypothetical protein
MDTIHNRAGLTGNDGKIMGEEEDLGGLTGNEGKIMGEDLDLYDFLLREWNFVLRPLETANSQCLSA